MQSLRFWILVEFRIRGYRSNLNRIPNPESNPENAKPALLLGNMSKPKWSLTKGSSDY